MTILECSDCGKTKKFHPSEISGRCARYRLKDGYRCRSCWNMKRRGKRINPRIKTTVTVVCSCCQSSKRLKPSEAKSLKQPYRCKKCGPVVNLTPVSCHECGSVRHVKASQAQRLGPYCLRCKNKGHLTGGRVWIACKKCDSKKSVRRSRVRYYQRSNGDYYCVTCSRLTKPCGPDNPSWRGGISFDPYPTSWNRSLKVKILTRDNFTCQECQRHSSSLKNGLLDVHHIDYDKHNLDHRNLISLCRSCHMKTNYNRTSWKVHFEGKIIAIYQEHGHAA